MIENRKSADAARQEEIMTELGGTDQNASTMDTAVDIATRLGGLLLMVFMCFQILRPFVSLVVWGIILAVAVYPGYQALNTRLGDRR
jgi:predicted PurR-regulated permease PerM